MSGSAPSVATRAIARDEMAVLPVQPDPGWTSYRGRTVAHLEGQLLLVPPDSGGFSLEELAALKCIVANQTPQAATVGPKAELNRDLRRARVAWREYAADTAWIFSRAVAFASFANRELGWNFDIRGPARALQLSRYDSADHGTFDWHMDTGHGRSRFRKLAVVMVIEAAEEGGQLECRTGSTPRSVPMRPGTAAIFPAYLQHRVTPVVRGQRVSVVSWMCGPPFR